MDQRIDPRKANIDWAAFREGQRAPATEAVGSALALDEIAKRETFDVSEADIDAELERYAEQTGLTVPASRRGSSRKASWAGWRPGLRREKAVMHVMSKAKIKKG